MKIGDVIWGIGILILVYLVLTHGPAVSRILGSVFGGTATLARTLQGR